MSEEVSRGLLTAVFNVPYQETGLMPINLFRTLVNQALNIGGYLAGGKLELKTEETKKDILKLQYDALKAKGII